MESTPDLLFEIPRGLDQSILLAVLVGFLVMLFMTEVFGWVFVGVVVPGYLASVLIIQPAAGLAVVLDAMLTYLVAKFFELVLGRGGASSEFFGRERFFLLVLVSVFVRQHTQTWVWPAALQTIDPFTDLSPGFQRGFSSIGLVLVPLMANLLWKLDLRRGAWQLLVTAGITYALLAWWLLPETTLSYSALELSYEDTAIDFLGNAKAYIIFLTTAYIASQLNLYYGWDFNGILVPALLGLLWFYPSKFATTVAESIILYHLTVRLPQLPGLRQVNLEGPRRLAMVFTFSVALKWVIGWVVGDSFPTVKITDVYGFGYLLPSLLSIKMMKKKGVRPVMLPTLVASACGFIAGNLIGFALSLAEPASPVRNATGIERSSSEPTSSRLLRDARSAGALAHLHALEKPQTLPDYRQTMADWQAWQAMAAWVDAPDPSTEDSARRAIAAAGLEIAELTQSDAPAFAVFEPSDPLRPRHGFGTALLLPGAGGPVLAVPRPLAEAPIAEASAELCRLVQCRMVVIAAQDVEPKPWVRVDTTSFEVALAALGRDDDDGPPMLVLRTDPAAPPRHPVLHLGSGLPEAIDLRRLWAVEVSLDWSAPTLAASTVSPRHGGTLRMHPDDAKALLSAHAPPVRKAATLPRWLARRVRDPLVQNLEPSPPPSRFEARYLEALLASPLIDIAAGRAPSTDLRALGWHAERLGLQVWSFADCGDGQACLGLLDPRGAEGMGWGALLVRSGDAEPLGIEVPRPGLAFGTHQIALELWRHTKARALYIGPSDEVSPKADALAVGNVHTPLLPFHQAMDRTIGIDTPANDPPLLVQVLGFGSDRDVEAELVVGLGRPVLERRQLPRRLQWLLAEGPLDWLHGVRMSDGSPELHALSGLGTPAMEFSLELGRTDTAILWFAPAVRERYVGRAHGEEERRLLALGMPHDLRAEVEAIAPPSWSTPVGPVPPEARQLLQDRIDIASAYAHSENIHHLRELIASPSDKRFDVDVESGLGALTDLPFVVVTVEGPGFALRAFVLLDLARETRVDLRTTEPDLARAVGLALFQRARVIAIEGGPLPRRADQRGGP